MNKLILLSVLILSAVGALAGASPANAASIYDTVYRVTDEVHIKEALTAGQCVSGTSTDVTFNWATPIVDESTWLPSQNVSDLTDMKNSFLTALENGRWGVSQITDNSVLVFWTEDTSLDLRWNPAGVNASSTTSNIYQTRIESSCLYTTSIEPHPVTSGGMSFNIPNSEATNVSTLPAYNAFNVNLFVYTDYPNYPTDYAGLPIVIDPPIPPVTSSNVPRWYISSILDFHASIHDMNFNTFDAIQWTCDDELAPIIHWTLVSDTFSTSGTQSATIPLEIDLPDEDSAAKYTLTGRYECGDNPIFVKDGVINFQVDQNGNQYWNFIENCFIDEFPFFDIPACITNFQTVLGLMGINIKFPTNIGEVPIGECRNLVTVDAWLNLPDNYQVCKQFPSSIRDIITPFISFAIGIMTMSFLAKRNRDDI